MRNFVARESWIACSLLATCLGVAGARAESLDAPACAARAKLAEARALAREGSYIAAAGAIDEGLACAPRDIDLLQLRARMALDRLDYAGALAAYEALLDAGLRGANRRKVLDILRTLRAARSTRVAINVNVPANVYLGARELGTACAAEATCTLSLLPGHTYRVLIERPSFKPVRHVVRPRQGETVTITQELEELPSPLSLSVTPADALVTIDGQAWQPGAPVELPAGTHEVRAWRAGYFGHQATFTAQLGEPVALAIDLDERVPVRVSPAGARVLPVATGGHEVALVERAVRLSGHDRGGPRVVHEAALRLAGTQRGQAVEVRVEADGYVPATVALPAERTPGEVLEVTLAPVPPPPPAPPDAPPMWPTLGTGAATLAGMGVAAFQALRAQQHMDRALALCSRDDSGGLSCPDPGRDALGAAERASTNASRAFALSAALAVGTLYAWSSTERADADGMSLQRKLSIGASGGVAATGLAVGILYGLRARSLRTQAQDGCDDTGRCDEAGFVLLHEARGATSTANLGFAVAGVAAAGAALLWWQTPDEASGLTITPVAGAGEVGVGVSGRY